ncbi:MAG: hypothetical protein CMO55_12500 [Verrucomicrobiales bacterium]|nr:hypothetical protein [Verrucomicrobiales bacterium]
MKKSLLQTPFVFAASLVLAASPIVAHADPGDISTIVGTGAEGYGGDGGFGLSATLEEPRRIACDPKGNLYFIDGSSRVRRYDRTTGIVSSYAGGAGVTAPVENAHADDIYLYAPNSLAIDGLGNVYVACDGSDGVFRIDAKTRYVTRYAGGGTNTDDGASALDANLGSGMYLAFDMEGHLYVMASANAKIRKIDKDTRKVTTVVGSGLFGHTGDGGPATDAGLTYPHGLCFDRENNLYIADTGNSVVRFVDAKTGIISTICGTGTPGYNGDNVPTLAAQLYSPVDVKVDRDGNVYIADTTQYRVRRIVKGPDRLRTITGTGIEGFSGDGGSAVAAKISHVAGLAIDSYGNLFLTDTLNHRIRRIEEAAPATSFQPDATVGKKRNGQKGNNVYTPTGAGQLQRIKSVGSPKAKFFFNIESDTNGLFADGMTVRVSGANRKFKPKYVQIGKGNVTAAMKRGYALEVGATEQVQFRAKVKAKLDRPRTRRTFRVACSSKEAGTTDMVKAKLKFRR